MDDTPDYVPRRCGIGMTALIDVVFILLMFFMLSSSFQRWNAFELTASSPVVVPATSTADPQIILLGAQGSLRSPDVALDLDHYRLLSTTHLAAFEGHRGVLLRADPEARLQAVVGTLEGLRRLGLENVSLGSMTDSVGPSGAATDSP